MDTSKRTVSNRTRGIVISAIVVTALAIVIAPLLNIQPRSPQEMARKRLCVSNLKALWRASMMYAQDNGGWMPAYSNLRSDEKPNGPTDGAPSREKLHSALSRYVKSQSVWFCLSDRAAGEDISTLDANHLYSSYVFFFGKPRMLRSSGVDASAMKYLPPDEADQAGSPKKWLLIRDCFFRYTGGDMEDANGSHLGGNNYIYLDGHTEFLEVEH